MDTFVEQIVAIKKNFKTYIGYAVISLKTIVSIPFSPLVTVYT